MNAERWREVDRLYHSALEREPRERAAFLAEACQGDEDLRRELDELLAQDSSIHNILDHPAVDPLADSSVAQLTAGTQLGPYKIEAPLGAGGMGEVYRAVDTRLKRAVAIKVAKENFGERFEREARAVAALNHPNICTLHDVGPNYLVMELIEGPTLAERIEQGPVPVEEALGIAKQIADALEAAHEKGITHRDLKPGNIKIKPDGMVKVLDFGLAKVAPVLAGDSPAEATAALTTRAGMILGTAAYMSPEQAQGKPVDRRADIWAFGVVVYEMLTGRRPFAGEGVGEILAAVIKEAPQWDGVPAKVRPLLERCLEKDPKRRLRDIGDMTLLLGDVGAGHVPPGIAHARPLPWAVAAGTLAVIAAVLAGVHFREIPPEQRSTRLEVAVKSAVEDVALSPDGRYLAFTASNSLWVRPLDSLEARALAGTEDARFPFWSPDSAFLGFFAAGKLKKIDVHGGPAQIVYDAPNNRGGGTWNRDGVILFAPANIGGLYRVSAAGGVPAPVTKPASPVSHQFPEFLPDGRHFLFVVASRTAETSGIYIGSLDGATERLLPEVSHAAYSPPTGSSRTGHLLFVRNGTLMAQPFDPERLRTTGEAFLIAEQVPGNAGVTGVIGGSAFSVSGPGTLAYATGAANRQLAWRDRTGKRLGLIGTPGDIAWELLSPDEKKAAYQIGGAANSSDIWVHDLMRNTTSRFAFGPGITTTPIWSPDGSRIVYGSSPQARQSFDIYQKPVSGASQAELVLHVGTNLRIYDWSPDGKAIVYSPDIGAKTRSDLWLLPLDGDRKPASYLQTEFAEYLGQFSRDGRWMAYTSDESGREQIYVQTVPPSGAKWQISTAGGSKPRWRRDGLELYYVAADRMLMAVPVKPGSSFETGTSQALFGPIPARPGTIHQFYYQPTGDGQRFMVNEPAGDANGPR